MLPLIALVGRPNVGKSTLFNRLTHTRRALVDDLPGVTRDRQYGEGRWGRRRFRVVDTGGFAVDAQEPMTALVREQALLAIEEADGIILVVDGKTGPLPDDFLVADRLRRSGKPLLCAVNKVEGRHGRSVGLEFHELGLHPLTMIAAEHAIGIEDMIEELFALLPEEMSEESLRAEAEPIDAKAVRVAIIGCPNAGKSSLINKMLGEERQIVSEVSGTTRDSVDLPLEVEGQKYILVDTAGIRRKNRISQRLEKFSVFAALKAIDRAETVILVLDAERGLTDQDKRVASYAMDAGCGMIFAVNKWDLMPAGDKMEKAFRAQLDEELPHMPHVPVFFISAKTGRQIGRLLPATARVRQANLRRIGTGEINRWLAATIERNPPPRAAGRLIKIRYATQVTVAPPTFLFFTNLPDEVSDSYRKYLENRLREAFDFTGAPIRLLLRKNRENPYV